MTKFLNESGFRRIVKTIKNALAGKQDKKLVVTVTGVGSDNITADKTYNEILAAYNSGADVLVDDGYGYFYHLIAFDSGWFVFMMKPHDEANSDYYLLVSSQNVWTSRTWEAQEKLISGTNIKTVNNTSLLGGGNISIEPNEIASITTTESSASGGNNTVTINTTDGTSKTFNVKNGKDGKDGQDGADGVSLGEIALVQTTGDSEESVMSQKAVTEYGRKVTAEDLNGTSEWIRAKLTEEGWEFGKYVAASGNLGTNANYCASFFIPVDMSTRKAHSISFGYMFNAWTTANVAFYNSEKVFVSGSSYYYNSNNVRTAILGTGDGWNNAVYMRITLNPNRLDECYVLDNTTGEYLFKGDKYLSSLCNGNVDYDFLENSIIAQELGDSAVKVMSQKAVKSLYYNPVSMFKGTLVNYTFESYPNLDLSKCNELSFVFDRRYPSTSWLPGGNSTTTGVTPFEIIKDVYNYLRIKQNGIYLNLSIRINGSDIVNKNLTDYTQLSPNEAEHIILCLDFKNALADIYMNGIVRYTNIRVAEEDLTPYVSQLTSAKIERTELWGSMGGAIVNSFLSSDEVTEIYNAGSYVDWFIPNAFVSKKSTSDTIDLSSIRVSSGGSVSDVTANSVTATCSGSSSNKYLQNSSGELLPSYIETKRVEIRAHIDMISGSVTIKGFGLNGRFNAIVFDSNGNEVSKTLIEGEEYDLYIRGVAPIGTSGHYAINFTHSSDCSFTFSNLNIKQIGAVVLSSPQNYYGTYFKQESGDDLFTSCTPFYEPYKFKIVPYTNRKPQFTGQIAIDSTNSKIYIGVNTTWKQINNS